MRQLKSLLVKVNRLSHTDKDEMFNLMVNHFDGVVRVNFEKDLQEKRWAILLRDKISQKLRGFSTYMLLDGVTIDGFKIVAIFSGDTIIDRNHWGCWELFKMFGKLSYKLHNEYKKNNTRLYWFLISMGYKTYRLLPTFFKEFYPRYDKQTPIFEEEIINSFGHRKFPGEYNRLTGVIHFSEGKDCLKEGIADITQERMKNAHIDFFCRKNPLHKYGDELACIAEFSKDNLRSAALRMIFGQS